MKDEQEAKGVAMPNRPFHPSSFILHPSLAGFVWGVLLLGVAVNAYTHPRGHTVYDIYAPAARHWWAGQDLYARGEEYYRYSPLFALGLTPLAFLPDPWGNALWKTFNALIYAAGLWAWARSVLPVRLGRNQQAALFLLALPTALHSLYIGQANLIMLGALLLGLAAAADERWNRAAGWFALATLVKSYAAALPLLLIVLHPRRLAARFAAALAVGLLLPFAAQRPAVVAAQYRSWLAHLRESEHIMRERLRSVDDLFRVCGYPIASDTFALLGVLAGGAVLGLCLWHARQTSDRRERLHRAFLLFSAWVVLFGPATEACTYALIAPAIAWVIVDAFRRQLSWAVRGLLIASLVLMGLLGTDFFPGVVRDFSNSHGGQPVGVLIFLAYLLSPLGTRIEPAMVPDATPEHRPAAAA
jgi:hypothetical protein